MVNGKTSILNSSMIVDFESITPLPNIQYQLVSSTNNIIVYVANPTMDQVTYTKTQDNSVYKIKASGNQLYIQFGKSCSNSIGNSDCTGHATCNDDNCLASRGCLWCSSSNTCQQPTTTCEGGPPTTTASSTTTGDNNKPNNATSTSSTNIFVISLMTFINILIVLHF
ncbi:hypothetical protein SAMD00019534_079410 [Acytostelium subglobosum LB1]|uniref:hypothetical protein n=1 Tax=Acytostelium subglobosum LB1 TaxID=1410327 RepID=UPI000645049D|nr:hypothetical protein SAMD00019534_079410 [Acytostelium subglobosum LB1]GAM24766.1 hypothetical protein SAMD00019534_079410 [Acytostelium subglobosum LB1]|eukprot:XP_012752435.1 hypothetical protein SAMD00019534_079410 [Acytostelium subglobosum LB1]